MLQTYLRNGTQLNRVSAFSTYETERGSPGLVVE